MKKYYVLFAGSFLLGALQTQAQTKIGAAGAPDASAMLEVTSGAASNKGLLLPKMTTTQRNGITSPATGLMIYNTTTNETQVNTGTPAAPVWTVATATATGWATVGNNGTTPATNFIGTTDNQPLTIRTNNTEQMRVTETGYVGIGTNAPGVKLQVVDTGDAAILVGNAAGSRGHIRLGNNNHGVMRDLTSSGGEANDVALYTSTGNALGSSLYLVSNPVSSGSDSLPLNQFVLKSTGNVGIGTNAPAQTLHVAGTARISTATGTPTTITGRNADGDVGNVTLGAGLSLTAGTLSVTGSTNNWDLAGNAGTNPTTNFIGTIDNQPLAIRTNNTEQMSVTANGNVGIGTNAPGVKLQVVDTGDAAILVGNAAGSRGHIQLGNDNHGMMRDLTTSGGLANDVALFTSTGNAAGSSLYLVSNPISTGSDSLPLDQFVLKNTGDVGIGIKDPATKLHIVDTGDVALRIGNSGGTGGHIQLGNDNHGLMRGLANSGGIDNDVALYTSSGPVVGASLYLAAKPAISDSIPLDQFVLKDNGNVGIGTGTPTAKLSVNGTTNNLSGTWGIFSDARVKTVDGEYEDGLATVMKIHPVKFHYNANAPFKSNEQQIGIIAQEMEQIAPYMVSRVNADGFTDLRQYNNQALPYMLVNAIQEQQAQIEALKAKNEQLEAKNEQLEASNKITAQLMERVKQMEQMMGINEIEGTSKVAGK